jgi:galactokinase
MIEDVRSTFAACFGAAPNLVARAPGRVNLIGEHTDYNDGFVLPAAIGVQSVVAIRRHSDAQIRVVAADYDNAMNSFSIDEPIVKCGSGWANYVRGTVKALLDAGFAACGADILISGTVPQGAGLSSSAALEVAIVHAFKTLCGFEDLDPTRSALIAQAAECDFVGTSCGIMDQLISARGEAGNALLIDCRSLVTTAVPIPNDLAIMIVHSGITRGLVEGAYNERRQQCEAVARHFGVAALRDVELLTLQDAERHLDAAEFRRARHVITENQRTLDAAVALRLDDRIALGHLMEASHASMRDDFDITLPAIDALVDILQSAIGNAGGARMTGGGFGGAVVALLPRDRVAHAESNVRERYRTPTGAPALIMLEQASQGASVLA